MKKKFIYNPWVIGIGTIVIGGLLLRVFLSINILNYLWEKIGHIGDFFVAEYTLPLYQLILVFVSGVFIPIAIILLAVFRSSDGSEEGQPPFLSYKEDNFDGILYKWGYRKSYGNTFSIENLAAFCPNCRCELDDERCPNCKKQYINMLKHPDELNKLIRHRIEQKFGSS